MGMRCSLPNLSYKTQICEKTSQKCNAKHHKLEFKGSMLCGEHAPRSSTGVFGVTLESTPYLIFIHEYRTVTCQGLLDLKAEVSLTVKGGVVAVMAALDVLT